MNGIHDLGGMHGFGQVIREENEPLFHAEWERRVLGVLVVVSANGHFNFDESRAAIERMGNERYLTTSYYEHWLCGLEDIVVDKGLLTKAEIAKRLELLSQESEARHG